MCKKKKKVEPVISEPAKEVPFENFELIKQEPVYDDKGNRDYFTEYYNAYKNDYIVQYLAAYKKMKGSMIEKDKHVEEEPSKDESKEVADL